MPDLKKVLEQYVATANNPKYNSDFNVINSKFPELKNYDKKILEQYVATANNEKYNSDFNVINSKFPELFKSSVEKKNPNENPLASSGTASSTESGKTTQRPNFVSPRSEPQSQFSDLGALNKEVVTKVTDNAKNAQVKNAQAGVYDKLMDVILPSSKILPNSIRSSIISSVAGFQAAAGGVADKVSDALFVEGSDVKKNIDKFVKNAYETAEMTNDVSQGLMRKAKLSNGINPDIDTVTYFESGNIVDGVKSLFSDMGGQTANMAMQATGVGGIIASGVSSFGSAVSQEVKDDGELSGVDFLQSVLQGSIDGVLAKFFNVDILAQKNIIKGLGGFLTKGGSALAKEVAEKGAAATKEKIIRTVADIGKKAVGGGKDEVKEELLATSLGFAVDLIDKDEVKVEDFKKLYHDLKTSGLLAITMGTGSSTIAAGFAMKKLTKEQTIEIGRYESILNDENTSKVAKDLAKRRISQIQDGVGYEADQNLKKAQKLNLEDKVKVNDLKNKIEELETDIDNSIAVQVKDDLLELKNVLVAELETILNSESGKVDNNQGASVQSSGTSETEKASEWNPAPFVDDTSTTTELEVVNEVTQVEDTVDSGEDVNKIIEGQAMQLSFDTTTENKVNEIESRMNNAEYIDEKDMTSAIDDLYNLLDEVDNRDLEPNVKEGFVTAIENKIKALESYELETTSQVVEPGQTKAVPRGIKIIGTTTRRGSKSKNEVTGERLNKKSVTAVDGTTGEVLDAEFVFNEGKLDVIDRKSGKSKEFDTGRLEYLETTLDDNGIVKSVTLIDNTQGDVFTINDPDIALDLSIQEKTKQLGEITDGVLEEVIQEVESMPKVETKVKSKVASSLPVTPTPPTPIVPTPPLPPTTPKPPVVVPPPPPKAPPIQTGPTTPEDANELSKVMVDEELEKLSAFNKKMEQAKKLLSGKKWWDRQKNIRDELKKAKAKVTEAFMTTAAGARSAADKAFEIAEKKIYGAKGSSDKMTIEDEKTFDRLIFLERVKQVDDNFDKRKLETEARIKAFEDDLKAEKARLKTLGKKPTLKDLKESEKIARNLKQQKANLKERPLHPKGFNKESAELAIEGIKREVGPTKFNELSARAKDYFGEFNKILKDQYDAGLINKETYERFKDDKYVPRWFLNHLLVEPGENKISADAGKTLSKEQIKAIEGGSDSLLFTDSRVLLNTALRSSRSKIAQNYANRGLAEVIKTGMDKGRIGKEANYSYARGVIKTDAFGNKVAKEADPGYKNMHYFNEDGTWDVVQVKTELYNEFVDIERQFDDFNPFLSKILMNGVLKSLATGINATFFITNVPVDYLNTILFTNTFSDTNIFNAGRKLAAAFTSNAYNYSKMEAGGNANPEFLQNYKEWAENGGMMQFLTDQGRPDEIAKRQAEIRSKKSFQPLNKAKKTVINTLAYTGELSEKAMRIAVFAETKNKLLNEAGGRNNISDKEYKELLALAASASRKTMDFAQGGLFGKKADVFLPYLNASIQGLRVAVEYMKDNPKAFVGKLAQFAVPVASLTLYNLSVMDDDENAFEDIPPRELQNYFIILKPWKNEDGKREYWRVKKVQPIQWFTTAVERATIEARDLAMGKKTKMGESFLSAEWKSINNALPIPLEITGALAKLPASIQAAVAYAANFDLFRDDEIVKDRDFGEVSPVLEGRYDKQVPLFYKKAGEAFGISPKRTQAATEKVLTSPGTNGMVGLMYSLLDNTVTAMGGQPKPSMVSKYQDISKKTFTDILSSRTTREINPNYSNYKNDKSEKRKVEINSLDKEIKTDIRQFVKDGTPKEEVKKYIKDQKIEGPEKERMFEFYKDNVDLKKEIDKNPDSKLFLDLKYERDPREKANIIFDQYGKVDKETHEEIKKNAKAFGFKLFGNDRFDAEYKRLISESETPSKSK